MASARNRRSDAESVIWPQVLLVVAVVALTLIGFVMIYSASQVTILSEAATNYYADTEAGQYLRDTISYSDYIAQQNPSAKLISQFIYSLAGIFIAVAIWFMLPRSGWKGAVVKGYWGVCVALLVITFLFGTAALGAQRWIVIGPLSLQPSEFAKIAIVLMAANLMDDLNEGDEFNSVMIRAALYVAAPTLFLLFTQSDLGTTIIIFVGVYAVLWFGGAPGKLMLAIAGVAVLAVIAIVLFGSGYRQDRFVVYNPWNDGEGGRGNGYQTIHSFYAFAEGGLFGVGLGNSSEKYDYLPEAETDFVFSIIGEEFGMLGALVVIALFCCILFAGMRLVPAAGIPYKAFEAAGFNRNHPLTLPKAIMKIQRSTKLARKWFSEVHPDCVVGFGGYVCIPVARAAEQCGIPVVVHEQNSVMGMANKYLARRARAVCLTYDHAARALSDKSHVVLTGNPVRASVFAATRAEGRAAFGVPEDARMLLVTGGSLGARHLNAAIVQRKDMLLGYPDLHIVHVTGPKELDSVTEQLALTDEQAKRWRLMGYTDQMGLAMAAADAIVSRAGATSLAEISARHIPALLVPFPYATEDHQTMNARACVEAGAAFLVADADVEGAQFTDYLKTLVEDETARQRMSAAAAAAKTRDAAGLLADVVLKACESKSAQ